MKLLLSSSADFSLCAYPTENRKRLSFIIFFMLKKKGLFPCWPAAWRGGGDGKSSFAYEGIVMFFMEDLRRQNIK